MNIAIYLGSSEDLKIEYIEMTKDVARLVSSLGFNVVYGGGQLGLMGVLGRECIKLNTKVIGVEVEIFYNLGYHLEGLSEFYVEKDFSSRRNKMIELSDYFLALPGGIGTLDEISEVMCLTNLYYPHKKVILYNYNGFYDPLIEMLKKMNTEGFLSDNVYNTYNFPKNISELKEVLMK